MRIRTIPKIIIGRREKADFPELELYGIDAKIDTGAYTSAIHCHDLKLIRYRGIKQIQFRLLDPMHPKYNQKLLILPVYARRNVKNSFGQVEERFIIQTKIALFGQVFDVELALADRSKMEYPVLLGRKVIYGRFVVDVSKCNLSHKQKLMWYI